MRFASIAYFMLCIHLAMVVVNGLGLFNVNLQPNDDVLSAVGADTIEDASYSGSQVIGVTDFSLGDLAKALLYFIVIFAKIVFIFPWTMIQFGVPAWMAIMFSIPIYSIYLFALVQVIGNRSFKSME